MFVDNAGQLIADVMTANRSLAGSVSASILDTSNYTFQAISYGKDPSGFGYHAHANIDSAFSWISYTKDPKIVEMKWEDLDKLLLYKFLPTTNKFIKILKSPTLCNF